MNVLVSLFAAISLALGACADARSGADGTVQAGMTSQQQAGPLTTAQPDESLPVAYFAGGCFWCTEASFERIKGVQAVVSGYSGGTRPNPTYKQVASGQTDYAEAIAIYYDSTVVDYPTLLDVFFVAHDPTTLNRQGPDVGPQYRSAIFYQNEREKAQAGTAIARVEQSERYQRPVVTEVTAYTNFYPAEEYHQGYYELHPNNSYITNVSRPKVLKVEKEFKHLLKEAYKS